MRSTTRRVKGTLVSTQRSFGLIEVEGRGEDRQLTLSAVNAKGDELWRKVIRAKELTIPRGSLAPTLDQHAQRLALLSLAQRSPSSISLSLLFHTRFAGGLSFLRHLHHMPE